MKGPSASAPLRDYDSAPAHVRAFYAEHNRRQTYAWARAKEQEYARLTRARMTAWEALERLDRLVDESDPDTEASQLMHALSSAERARRAGQPEWFVLTALLHDLGKMLCVFGEPQWAVVGDSFPLGCAFAPALVFHEEFEHNPDAREPRFQTACGIYAEGCGLDALQFCFGHDAYLERVLREQLPTEALYVIRYHSFYAQHQHGAYEQLCDARDAELMPWVRRFQPCDLYSKTDELGERAELVERYRELVERWLPAPLAW